MAEILISKFAEEIGLPAELLLEKLKAAGIDKSGQSDSLSQKDKMKLLDFLRGGSSTSSSAKKAPKKKMTEIKKVSNLGKTRTIEIKVKTKKTIPQKIIKDSVKKQVESSKPQKKILDTPKAIESAKTTKQNLEQKTRVESEITSVNEFKKKSFETDKKNIAVEDKQQKVTKKLDEKKMKRISLIRLLRRKNILIS